jgi:hypothetical protein
MVIDGDDDCVSGRPRRIVSRGNLNVECRGPRPAVYPVSRARTPVENQASPAGQNLLSREVAPRRRRAAEIMGARYFVRGRSSRDLHAVFITRVG